MPRTLSDLLHGLPITLEHGSGHTNITEIVEDSRLATPGCLFIARTGTKSNGREFIADAVKAGAVAVLTDNPSNAPANVAALCSSDVPLAAALLAERYFGDPSRSLRLIGITGTNGKTTTAYLVRHLLNSAGIKCGLMGTVQTDDGAEVLSASLTTPPPIEISRLLRNMVDNGCKACVMETSSHALHQKRTAALNFRVGVFTNLTGDHLDYHQSMDAYFNAKAILFEQLPTEPHGVAVLNIDDPVAEKILTRTKAQFITCSLTDRSARCLAKVGEQTIKHTEVIFSMPDGPEKSLVGGESGWGKFECRLPLLGRHNVCNALQAMAVGYAMGLDRETLRTAIETCKAPPGRLEPVTSASDGFAVLVDYAHTDDALENVLRAVRPVLYNGGKLRVVFGCGGDRDRTKRPRMAAVACKYADDVIITSDNPRTEDPQSIIDHIRAGVPHERLGQTLCFVDRAHAIQAAVDRVNDGDILLIAGKGHEDYQIIGTTKRPFDDRIVAAQAIKSKKAKVSLA